MDTQSVASKVEQRLHAIVDNASPEAKARYLLGSDEESSTLLLVITSHERIIVPEDLLADKPWLGAVMALSAINVLFQICRGRPLTG